MSNSVLIAESSESGRTFFSQLFRGFGFNVTTARTGAEAIRSFQESPRFDLVFMCDVLSDMSGFAVTKRIRELQMAKRPFVVGFSDGSAVDNLKVADSGMDAFVASAFGKGVFVLPKNGEAGMSL
jgi:CheY-like chemotaxis protein